MLKEETDILHQQEEDLMLLAEESQLQYSPCTRVAGSSLRTREKLSETRV